jgi:tetratricopeptide (TPR) repeat protein
LAEADAESQQIPEAIAEYKAAIERSPRHPGLHEELGDLYWANEKRTEADAEYMAELEIDPYSAMSEYKLGCLRELAGNYADAAALLGKAIALDPSIENAYYYLGRAQIELGDDTDGVANLERASTAKGDPSLNAQALYQLSRVYRRLHRNAEADKALALFRTRRAESERAEAEGRSARIARHELPKQEALPADPAGQP